MDCNDNGVDDICEPDCNGNGVADECDISTGSGPVEVIFAIDTTRSMTEDDIPFLQANIDELIASIDGPEDRSGVLNFNDGYVKVEAELSGSTEATAHALMNLDGPFGLPGFREASDIAVRHACGGNAPCVQGHVGAFGDAQRIVVLFTDNLPGGCNGQKPVPVALEQMLNAAQSADASIIAVRGSLYEGEDDPSEFLATLADETNGIFIDRGDADVGLDIAAAIMQLRPEGSMDCNNNGVPDECDILDPALDCNGNDVVDSCEIEEGIAPDCNENGIPDACDIASGFSTDCNGNLIPDSCDITIGDSEDCNANFIPDECDVAFGISDDCNGNGIPDECDATDPMMDCDANGVTDTCELGNPVTEFNSGIRSLPLGGDTGMVVLGGLSVSGQDAVVSIEPWRT